MSSFPGSPRLLKGGIVLVDPDSAAVQRIISLQYNPDSLSRTLQVQAISESQDRSEMFRIKAPAVEFDAIMWTGEVPEDVTSPEGYAG